MKQTFIIAAILFLSGYYSYVNAQPGYSPNVSNLGLYGQIPVSYASGLPSIEIPLHEAKGKDLSVPISISYHASGVKPNQKEGWLGTNWSLFAGGVINREIKGSDDFLYGWNNNSEFNTEVYTKGLFYGPLEYFEFDKLSYNIDTDLEPDIFTYNFCGYQGRFFSEAGGGKVYVTPNSNFKISISDPEITIVADDGIIYTFGGPNATETSGGYSSAWHLSKIKNPNTNEEITFEYYTQQLERQANYEKYAATHVIDPWNGNQTGSFNGLKYVDIYPSYLNKIITNREIIEFKKRPSNSMLYNLYTQPSDAWKFIKQELYEIDIFDKSVSFTEPYKKIIFNYLDDGGRRMELLSVSELMKDNSLYKETKPPYKFEYYHSGYFPSYSTHAIDHWGYFNNHPSPDLIPDPLPASGLPPGCLRRECLGMLAAYGVFDKSIAQDAAVEGVLKKIIYPTKGSSTFEYEHHTFNGRMYTSPINSKCYAGGIRIRKITNKDLNEVLINEKSYEYPYEGTVYYNINANDYHFETCIMLPNGNIVCNPGYTSRPFYTGMSQNGNHVSYSPVKEILGLNNGYKVYYFTEDPDQMSYNIIEIRISNVIQIITSNLEDYAIKDNMGFKRGLILLEATYDHNNILKEEITYQYRSGPTTYNLYYPSIGKKYLHSFNQQLWAYNKNYYYNNYLTQKTKKTWMAGLSTPVTETTIYNYNNLEQVSQVSQINSDNSKNITKYKYPSDYGYTGSIPGIGIDPLFDLKRFNMISSPIETQNLLLKNDGNTYLLNGEFVNYKYFGSVLKPYQIFKIETNIPLTDAGMSDRIASNNVIKNSAYVLEMIYDAYDGKGNILNFHKENDGLATSYTWDNNGIYPLTKTITGTDGINLTESWTWKPLVGMETHTDPSGLVTRYEYDTFGRLQYIKNSRGELVKKYEYNYKTP